MRTRLDVSAITLERLVRDVVAECEASGVLAPGAGIALAVVANGEVAYQGAYGLRDRGRGLPVTTRTTFEIGSLSKSLTAAALVKLDEEGKLSLHAPHAIATSMALPPAARGATLADILCHRTGLPGHDLLWYLGGYSTRELAGRLEHVDTLPEGLRGAFAYNNALYGCTRLLVEDGLGATWESAVSEALLAPLGMRATALDPSAAVDDEALPYDGLQPMARARTEAVVPAGGVRSTLEDMTTWALAQLGRRPDVLSASATTAMHEPRISAASINPLLLSGFEWLGVPDYGYGWFIGAAAGEKALFHMGLIDGFSTAMILFPALELGLVTLVNANLSRFPGLIGERLFEHVTGRERAPVKGEPPAPTADAIAAPVAPVIAPPAEVEGRYEHPTYGDIGVARIGDEVRLSWRGHEWPLRFETGNQATITVQAFGLPIPLPVTFTPGRVEVPFALDARVPAQAFVRIVARDA